VRGKWNLTERTGKGGKAKRENGIKSDEWGEKEKKQSYHRRHRDIQRTRRVMKQDAVVKVLSCKNRNKKGPDKSPAHTSNGR
jgi:hypothetical protein